MGARPINSSGSLMLSEPRALRVFPCFFIFDHLLAGSGFCLQLVRVFFCLVRNFRLDSNYCSENSLKVLKTSLPFPAKINLIV